jgi:hypothetical protein
MLTARHTLTAQDRLALLNCRRLPGRLNCAETALLLGFQEHDIGPLIAARLLSPLGKPAQNAPKYFAALEIIARTEDRDWLSQASLAMARFWSGKNRGKRTAGSAKA